MMKIIASILLVLGLLTIQVSEADAAACAAGPHRAGCVGPRGLWRALLLARRRAHLPLTRTAATRDC
jgi:hypothetical protein